MNQPLRFAAKCGRVSLGSDRKRYVNGARRTARSEAALKANVLKKRGPQAPAECKLGAVDERDDVIAVEEWLKTADDGFAHEDAAMVADKLGGIQGGFETLHGLSGDRLVCFLIYLPLVQGEKKGSSGSGKY